MANEFENGFDSLFSCLHNQKLRLLLIFYILFALYNVYTNASMKRVFVDVFLSCCLEFGGKEDLLIYNKILI